jgi:hypothetical protein
LIITKRNSPLIGELLLSLKPEKIFTNEWVQCEIDLQMSISPNWGNHSIKTNSGLPEPTVWTKQLVTGIAEVLIGERPVFQLMRWVSFEVYQEIDRQVLSRTQQQNSRVRPFIRTIRVEITSEKVVEAIAVIQKGQRGRGMGLRLEAEKDRWRCTQLLVA